MISIFVSTAIRCPGCEVIKSALARAPIQGVLIRSIDTDLAARAEFNRLGVQSVPAARINGAVLVGAAPILRALGR